MTGNEILAQASRRGGRPWRLGKQHSMEVFSPKGLPPDHWRRLINEYASVLPDSTLRLKFTRNVLKDFNTPSRPLRLHSSRNETAFRKALETEILKLLPGSESLLINALREGDISRRPFLGRLTDGFRNPAGLFVFSILILGVCAAGFFLSDSFNGDDQRTPVVTASRAIVYPVPHQKAEQPEPDHPRVNPFSWALLENKAPFQHTPPPASGIELLHRQNQTLAALRPHSEKRPSKSPIPEPETDMAAEHFPEYIEDPIWLVEKTNDVESYSNGLQINTSFYVDNIPRSYVVFPKNVDTPPKAEHSSTKIRGILYHASEGDMVPFKPEKNRLLKKYSSQLLQYIAREKAYHYLIDRFGRVYRIVREKDAAFHAGKAIWADEDAIFLNLNHAFIGICFEGKGFEEVLEPGSTKPKIRAIEETIITEAQIHAGKELTDRLRFQYGISQGNCVPHSITSVYPKNRLIGYHLDLAHGFPFHRFGLSNKYTEMIPSITEFGFKEDHYFHEVLNGDVWPGIKRSEAYLAKTATEKGISLEAYRKQLNQRFDSLYDRQKQLQNGLETEETPKK